jgi:hypothetical protein
MKEWDLRRLPTRPCSLRPAHRIPTKDSTNHSFNSKKQSSWIQSTLSVLQVIGIK